MSKVLVCMGSDSDAPIMKEAADVLRELGLRADLRILSAHRTPQRMMRAALEAEEQGYRVIIAGAGGAAHLPGMVASLTPLPVIGVPIRARISLDGWDSILSILQMPPGVPVATVALDGGRNAGILAAQIVGASDSQVRDAVRKLKAELAERVTARAEAFARNEGGSAEK